MYSNILVLGGTGFLGKNLQQKYKDWIFLGREYFVQDNIKCGIDPIDLTNKEQTRKIIEDFNPDVVINLAAMVGGVKFNSGKMKQLFSFEDNSYISMNVISACRELEVERCITALSTCAWPEAPSPNYPLNESQLLVSVHPMGGFYYKPFEGHKGYGWAKRMSYIHTCLARDAGFDYVTFAPSNIYGPCDNFDIENGHFVASLIAKVAAAKEGDVINLWGSGSQLRQQLYVGDLVELMPTLITSHRSDRPLIIAPDENLSIEEMAKLLIEVSGKDLKLEFNGKFMGQYRKDCKNDAIKHMRGGYKFTTLKEGIKKTYEWYLENEEKC